MHFLVKPKPKPKVKSKTETETDLTVHTAVKPRFFRMLKRLLIGQNPPINLLFQVSFVLKSNMELPMLETPGDDSPFEGINEFFPPLLGYPSAPPKGK